MENKITVFDTRCNCYAIENGDQAVLVDIGGTNEKADEYIAKNAEKIKYILLTHAHYDHILGVEEVLSKTKAKSVIHEKDAAALNDPYLNLCEFAGFDCPSLKPDIVLKDGDVLPFSNTEIKAVHTPGHTVGSCVYVIGEDIFCGDTVFFESIGRTDLPGGSVTDILKSIEKLRNFGKNYNLYPGHGPKTTLEYEKENNPFFKDNNLFF